ncbi:hypothetical protein ACTG9Q_32240 [Actinokineospora sp. 24-640]
MALTYSCTPSTEPARPDRLPSLAGFTLFETCIGGALYDVPRFQDLPGSGWTPAPWLHKVPGHIEAPIVAVTWSCPPPPTDNQVHLSFYTPHRPPRWDRLPPQTHVAHWTATQTPYSAAHFTDHVRDVLARTNPPPAHATFSTTLTWGEPLPDPGTSHCAGWVQTLYGLWQLLDHTLKKPLTHTQVLPAPRPITRGDTRAGITATSTVNIIRVHPNSQPKTQPQTTRTTTPTKIRQARAAAHPTTDTDTGAALTARTSA